MASRRLGRAALAAFQLLGLQAADLAGEDWKSWPQCAHDAPTPKPDAAISSLMNAAFGTGTEGRQLTWNDEFKIYQKLHQLVTINADDGTLQIGAHSEMWDQLAHIGREVKIIVLFGEVNGGKSTLGSMMSCHMKNSSGAMLFPVHKEEAGGEVNGYTEGIWSSPPFDWTAADGTTSKYMIFDMQSFKRLTPLFGGKLPAERTNHALYKMLAVLSEVASVFVQVLKNGAAGTDEWDLIGGAFQTTRESIVASSKEGERAPIDSKNDIRAANNPAMIVLARQASGRYEMVNQDEFTPDTSHIAGRAHKDYQALQHKKVFAQLLESNFEPVKGYFNGSDTEYPFSYSMIPQLAEASHDGYKFDWVGGMPYDFKEDSHCDIFDRMYEDYWKCTVEHDPNSPLRPSYPATYRLWIGQLVEQIAEIAPVRMLHWKGQDELLPLTGNRLKEVLEAGLKEMNAVGPLPQTELWRRIMQDRCDTEIRKFLDVKYGEKTGIIGDNASTGILKDIDEGLERLRQGQNSTLDEMDTEWNELNSLWASQPSMPDAIADWFASKTLMRAVQPHCNKTGVRHSELLTESYNTRVAEWGALREMKRRQDVEAELRKARKRIGELEWALWWSEMRFYVLIFGVLGLGALIFLMRCWAQCHTTCRTCLFCCGDYGDTTHETTITQTKHAKGTVTTGIHQSTEGPAMPFAMATTAGADSKSEERYKRLQELDETIKGLQARENPGKKDNLV